MNQQMQGPPGAIGMRNAMHLASLVINGHATCLTVFLRHSFGSEALGVNGIAAILVMVFFMAMYGGSQGMECLFGLWFVMLVLQRMRTFWLAWKGVPLHSLYTGYPWLGNLLTLGLSNSAARFVEMLVCLVAGAAISAKDPQLGNFVALGFVSLMLQNGIENRVDRMRLRRMRDAEIEQRFLLGRYRDGRF